MQKFTFPRQSTGFFTDQQNQLAYDQESLLTFIGHSFSRENFEEQINDKKGNYSIEKREQLVTELKNKYADFKKSEMVDKNLEFLRSENTFTITTGHQLSIFTGPIYLIYKIIHVIRLCEELKKESPEYNFVPVFWMASEDHDFEEIQSLNVFNKSLVWETEQQGPVGRFDLNGLDLLKKELLSFYANQPNSEVESLLEVYDGRNLGEATFRLIHHLFERFGLVILDGDNRAFKKEFIPVVEKELNEQFSYNAVYSTNLQIVKEGFKLQVNAREINLFYIQDQIRERILHLDVGFYIEGKGKMTKEQLLFELHEFPERFSPNVILRPVYQETILPNLCYVGGVGEMSYWLQLKGVFDSLGLTYPLIQVRTSLMWIDPVVSKKIMKTSVLLEDLFLDVSQIKKKYLKSMASEDVDFSSLDSQFQELKGNYIEKIIQCDPSLDKFANAEMIKIEKQLTSMQDKLVKAVKQKHDVGLKTIEQIAEKLFPINGMQERSLNLFTLSSDGNVSAKIDQLYKLIVPFDPDFIIIRE